MAFWSRIPRWGRWLMVLGAAALVVGLALPYFLNVDRYRPDIIKAIETATGRKVRIDRLSARFLPTVRVTMEGFALASPDRFGDQPLVTVERVQASVGLFALLFRKEVRLSGVRLTKPSLRLLIAEDGHTNYEFPPQPAAAAASAPSYTIADIDAVQMDGLDVLFAEAQGGAWSPRVRVSDATADVKNVSVGAPDINRLKAGATFKAMKLDVPGLAPLEIDTGTVSSSGAAVSVEFTAAAGKAAAISGTASVQDLAKPVVRFEIHTKTLDLEQLSSITGPVQAGPSTPGAPAPKAPAPAALAAPALLAEGRVIAQLVKYGSIEGTDVSTDVRVFSDRTELGAVSFFTCGGTITGAGTLDYSKSPARVSASLQAQKLGLTRLLAMLKASAGMTGTAEANLQIAGPIGDSLLHSMTGRGRAAVRSGTLPGFGRDGFMSRIAKYTNAITFGTQGNLNDVIPYRSLTGDVLIGNGRIYSRLVRLDSDAGTVDVHGSTGFDSSLDYDGSAMLLNGQTTRRPDDVVSALKGLFSRAVKESVGRIAIPFTVRGTTSAPTIAPGR